MVHESLRLSMLNQLLSLLKGLGTPVADWWQAEYEAAQQVASVSGQAALQQLALVLILALAKQGSCYQALRLFRALDHVTPSQAYELQPVGGGMTINLTSTQRKTATGLALAEALVARKRIEEADEVISKLVGEPSHGPLYLRYLITALSIKSALGNLTAVEQLGPAYVRVWKPEAEQISGRNSRRRLHQRQPASLTYARARIEALAVSGNLAEAEHVFRSALEGLPKERSPLQRYAVADLYAEMMKAQVAVDSLEVAQVLFDELLATDGPSMADQRHFNFLLQGYATRADLGRCTEVIEEMTRIGLPPDFHVYGNACMAFGNIQEPESILNVIEMVMRRGWEPGRELWNMLLDGYVEVGDWPRASRLLAFLESEDSRREREADGVTKGIVLKALVLSGAPTDEVVESFKAMYNERAGTGPADTRAYTLLLQSVCDSGMMDLAEAIFFSLKEHAPSGVEPNVFMYGIMICAFLRLGKKSLAQFYFEDMRQYGLRPNSIIYAMVTAAYARSSGSALAPDGDGPARDGVELAREMVKKFKEEMAADGLTFDERPPTSPELGISRETDRVPSRRRRVMMYDLPSVRQQASHRLLAPIIQSYVKTARPAKALEVVKELVESFGPARRARASGEMVELDVYTMLLDGYRRAGDPEGASEIWRRIFEEAVASEGSGGRRHTERDRLLGAVAGLAGLKEVPRHPTHRAKNHVLCLPLSIYTDTLASHGFHEEVSEAWEAVQEAGFAFDPANFNHLCIASLKSGKADLAWAIVEHVLLAEDHGSSLGVEGGGGEKSDWPGFLRAGVVRRGLRDGVGGKGEETQRLETEGPIRPPNRTSVRKAQRFDDEPAARNALESLLNSLRSPTGRGEGISWTSSSSSPSLEEKIGNRRSGGGRWSDQVEAMGRARRMLGWKPYGKVLRMLHGSMWRKCSDLIVLERRRERRRDEDEEVKVGLILNDYRKRYPKTMLEVLRFAIDLDRRGIGVGGSGGSGIGGSGSGKMIYDDQWIDWALRDFVVRVIARTTELMGS